MVKYLWCMLSSRGVSFIRGMSWEPVILEQTGHVPSVEVPERFGRELLKHISRG